MKRGLKPDENLTYFTAPELVIKHFLEDNNIIFEAQKTFDGCKNKDVLPFDFYLPKHNLIIEYDGPYHYKNISGKLGIQRKHDNIKNEYCRINNINLLRVPYWEEFQMIKHIESAIK